MLSAVVPSKAGTAVFLMPLAENRAADPHMSSAQLDRGHEIRAHAHRQQLEPVAPRDLGGEREMRPRRLVERRNAHQPRNGQAVDRADASLAVDASIISARITATVTANKGAILATNFALPRNVAARCIYGSSTVSTRSTAGFSRICSCPLGQWMVSLSAFVALPRPKWTRPSSCER